jgi:hypothetical protein
VRQAHILTTVDYGQGDTNTGLASTLAADLNAGNAVGASASSNLIYPSGVVPRHPVVSGPRSAGQAGVAELRSFH